MAKTNAPLVFRETPENVKKLKHRAKALDVSLSQYLRRLVRVDLSRKTVRGL